ncbi:MAG: serine/threonine-protein kinase, partial [Acidobacteriota bacterium]
MRSTCFPKSKNQPALPLDIPIHRRSARVPPSLSEITFNKLALSLNLVKRYDRSKSLFLSVEYYGDALGAAVLCVACARVFSGRTACARCGADGTAIFEGFRVERELGAGGNGVVFLAHRIDSGESRAIKLVSPLLRGDDNAVRRFLREADLAIRVRHENLAICYSCKQFQPGQYYIESEFADGPTLKDRLTGTPPDWRTILRWGIAILDALAALHREAIVHRDIKPANVVLLSATQERRLKVVDLGLAKSLDVGSEIITNGSGFYGTVSYAAPERLLESGVTAAADVFSAAVVIFELLARRHPFAAGSTPATIHAITYASRPELTSFNPALPAGLDSLFIQAMSVIPSSRPTAVDFSRRLREVMAMDPGVGDDDSTVRMALSPAVDQSESSSRNTARSPIRPNTEREPRITTKDGGLLRRMGGTSRQASRLLVVTLLLGVGGALVVVASNWAPRVLLGLALVCLVVRVVFLYAR